ncbi:MAG: alpha/beta hydrolase [Gammaproteobacteria bacterium]|nr:MAG: alpha/beta hydrolase [Gammaproteobacteria bacterium]PIE36845.1 MAG: alpha/beta hydrolase [Gammaproteobacteria bacterium]
MDDNLSRDRHWPQQGELRGTVVLVHGIGEHSGRYERFATALAQAGFRVHGFDLPGHGRDPGRRADVQDWSLFLDAIAARVVAEREAAAAAGAPLILFGHSMGGLLSLEYVLSERPAPHLLVLSAPALAGGAAWQRLTAPLAAALAARLRLPTGIRGEDLSRDPEVARDYFADPLVETRASTYLAASLFSAMRRCREGAKAMPLPTLVLHGDHDRIVPPDASACIDGDDVTRRVYAGLRHELLNEPEAAEITSDIIVWLESRRLAVVR